MEKITSFSASTVAATSRIQLAANSLEPLHARHDIFKSSSIKSAPLNSGGGVTDSDGLKPTFRIHEFTTRDTECDVEDVKNVRSCAASINLPVAAISSSRGKHPADESQSSNNTANTSRNSTTRTTISNSSSSSGYRSFGSLCGTPLFYTSEEHIKCSPEISRAVRFVTPCEAIRLINHYNANVSAAASSSSYSSGSDSTAPPGNQGLFLIDFSSSKQFNERHLTNALNFSCDTKPLSKFALSCLSNMYRTDEARIRSHSLLLYGVAHPAPDLATLLERGWRPPPQLSTFINGLTTLCQAASTHNLVYLVVEGRPGLTRVASSIYFSSNNAGQSDCGSGEAGSGSGEGPNAAGGAGGSVAGGGGGMRVTGRSMLAKCKIRMPPLGSSMEVDSVRCVTPMDPMSHEMSCIIDDFLYLGNEPNSADLDLLRQHSITHILNVTDLSPNAFETEFRYLRIRVADNHSTKLCAYFEEAIAFIEEARLSGGRILVHCQAGISRSTAIVTAYLVWQTRQCSVFGIINFIKTRRSIVGPNFAFLNQLHQFHMECRAAQHAHTHAHIMDPDKPHAYFFIQLDNSEHNTALPSTAVTPPSDKLSPTSSPRKASSLAVTGKGGAGGATETGGRSTAGEAGETQSSKTGAEEDSWHAAQSEPIMMGGASHSLPHPMMLRKARTIPVRTDLIGSNSSSMSRSPMQCDGGIGGVGGCGGGGGAGSGNFEITESLAAAALASNVDTACAASNSAARESRSNNGGGGASGGGSANKSGTSGTYSIFYFSSKKNTHNLSQTQ